MSLVDVFKKNYHYIKFKDFVFAFLQFLRQNDPFYTSFNQAETIRGSQKLEKSVVN